MDNLLIRLLHIAIIESGAFGVLLWRDLSGDFIPIAVTLERTYGNGITQSVKIPLGIHLCTRTVYIKGGYETFEIHIEGRFRILFHKLNVETESEGCVGIGEQFGFLNGSPAILQSGAGFTEFMGKMKGIDEFYLQVL